MSFSARYPGRCPECGETIYEGDSVMYDDDDQVIHEECYEDDMRDLDSGWKTVIEP